MSGQIPVCPGCAGAQAPRQPEKRESLGLTLWLALLTAGVVVAGALAVPVLVRPFYYAHIGPLGLSEYTGLHEEVIRRAYGEMLDYCIGLRPDFAVGGLPFSADGAAHFADVRRLFLLDLGVLVCALAALAITFLVCRRMGIKPRLLRGHGPGFWGAVGLGGAMAAVGVLAALDFQRAFYLFHALFFPGKSNWLFDWRTDPVILLLPQEFFRNCALLILILVLVWCAVLVAADLAAVRRRKRSEEIQ